MSRAALLAALACCTPTHALAQASANATAAAKDAFGYRDGDDTIGIYDESSVRGFDLEAAGNYRIEGGYFVKNSGVSAFFVESSTVRIGHAALRTILPGPSGVVDYRLRDPSRGEASTLTAGLDPYGQAYADLHLKHRSRDDGRSVSLGLGVVPEIRDLQGGRAGGSLLLAGVARFDTPLGRLRVLGGEYRYERPAQFRVVASADSLPGRLERGLFLGQRWATERGQRRIAGLLIDKESGPAGVGATAVFSQEHPVRSATQFLSDPRADGTVRSTLVVAPEQRSTAWSGELRGHVAFGGPAFRQRVDVSVRGRSQTAAYGGAGGIDLGRTRYGAPAAQVARIDPTDVANLRDDIEQWGVGIAYRAEWRGSVRLNAGLLKTHYRKVFTAADGFRATSSVSPLLPSFSLPWQATGRLEVYASYSRGLEEAGTAPSSAVNRNQVLGAIKVTQREVGVRYQLGPSITAVAAAFETVKPYAGLDAGGVYRTLGDVTHRGVELSVAGSPAPGLSIVAGAALIDPKLRGVEVDRGRIGARPVGVPDLKAVASVDYALPGLKGLSADASFAFTGSRAARSTPSAGGGQLEVRSLATLNLGVRYGFKLAGHALTARLQVLNALDAYGWDVNSSETLNYNAPRRFRLAVTAAL